MSCSLYFMNDSFCRYGSFKNLPCSDLV